MLSGDYLSAASFLGIAGAIAVNGYDGFLYSIGFPVAWPVSLLLVAEPLRDTGRFTIGDVLAFRMRQRPVRAAAATSSLVISVFYMLAQMAGAGALIALLLDIRSGTGQSLNIVVVGVITIFSVLVGGMKGTTWVQIIKASLLLWAVLISVFLIGKYGFNISSLRQRAAEHNPLGVKILGPGAKYGKNAVTELGFLSVRCRGRCGSVLVFYLSTARTWRCRWAGVRLRRVGEPANLSTLLLSLCWRRFNTTGTLWGIYGG